MLFDSNGTPIAELKTAEFKAELDFLKSQAKGGQESLAPLLKKGGGMIVTPELDTFCKLGNIIAAVERIEKLIFKE